MDSRLVGVEVMFLRRGRTRAVRNG
jgi:hypothetical protein